jgi:hypothetical protein
MRGLRAALGFLALASFPVDAAEDRPRLHVILSDGHNQLQGQSKQVANEMIAIFRTMGIDLTWSSDPSAWSTTLPSVLVSVVPHSGRDWGIGEETLAAVMRDGPDSPGSVFLFYPDIALNFRPGRKEAIRNAPRALVSWQVGIARVITHEILHFFLPGRPHDESGIFLEKLRRDTLLRPGLEVSPDTREALVKRLREGESPGRQRPGNTSNVPGPAMVWGRMSHGWTGTPESAVSPTVSPWMRKFSEGSRSSRRWAELIYRGLRG